MHIAEQSDDRLVVTHGAAWLLVAFGLTSALLLWGLVFLASRLGVDNEPVAYTAVFLAICLYGLFNTRLTRFEFDRPAGVLRWRRRGVVPASGEVPFGAIDRPVLEARTDRKGTAYYRVALALGRDQALPVVPGRTRDLFACLDLLDGVSRILGQPNLADLVAAGQDGEAVRLAENRYGIPRERVETYLERRARRRAAAGPSCAV
jgi:hypothetical protein